MPKNSTEKAAWEWVSSVNANNIDLHHLQLAYRLNLDPCSTKANACRRNCRNNPKCIVGLGEKKWIKDFERNADRFNDIQDPNCERRDDKSFIGLKNLGATCYVNSLLQVWYHNPFLRDAIYKWNPDEDSKEIAIQNSRTSETSSFSGSFNPVSPLGQLQLVFAKLQFSSRCYVDPEDFVRSLELDVSQQQDAQEFSKLFLSLLEEDLKTQRNSDVRNIIQTQYCGEYEYVTRCTGCETSRSSASKFYELTLNIKGHKDIHGCLSEFFSPEIMEGSNQCYCDNCGGKQDAIRGISLKKLPLFLNLQLLRFIYDKQKKCRKKINSFISFPEAISLKEYMDTSKVAGSPEYLLCAVLVHRGQSAHSGHYIAHIKDRETGSWYKFNDETVEKIKGKVLKLADDSDIEEISPKPDSEEEKHLPKLKKHQYASNDAYMLVYRNSGLDYQVFPSDNAEGWDIPEYLQTAVMEDNSKFEEWVDDLNKMRSQNFALSKERQKQIRGIYDKLILRDNEPYEWISKKWLSEWLNSDFKKEIPPVDNSFALCIHKNLSLGSLPDMKCVSSIGAEEIYQLYGGGPRMRDVLCRTCVEEKVRQLQIERKVQEDQKQITRLLKFKIDHNKRSYWVGKESFMYWKQMVHNHVSVKGESSSDNGDSDSENQPPSQSENVKQNDKLDFDFNEDLLCQHNRLACDEASRRLVSAEVWNILKGHFPSAPEFDSDSVPCAECLNLSRSNETVQNECRERALEQKQRLQDLYSQKRRISWNGMQIGESYYALNRKFFSDWKNFLRDPLHNENPMVVDNSSILCDHQKLLYAPHKVDPLAPDSKFIMVSEGEWSALMEFYRVNFPVKLWVEGGERLMRSDPPYCEPCHTILALREKEQLLNYNNATIYVRKIQNKCENEESLENNATGDDDSFDKPFTNIPSRKMKSDLLTEKVMGGDSLAPRRSKRRRKYRDVKEFTLSSDQTLKDLKVMIMSEFKVATYDQHLYLNEALLEGNDKTLASLNVEPSSLIYLRVDEAVTSDVSLMEEYYSKDSAPEMGFKGTQLQKC